MSAFGKSGHSGINALDTPKSRNTQMNRNEPSRGPTFLSKAPVDSKHEVAGSTERASVLDAEGRPQVRELPQTDMSWCLRLRL